MRAHSCSRVRARSQLKVIFDLFIGVLPTFGRVMFIVDNGLVNAFGARVLKCLRAPNYLRVTSMSLLTIYNQLGTHRYKNNFEQS